MQARNTIQLSDWIVNLESQKQKPKEKLVVIEERKISKGKQKEKKKKKISKKKQELIDARNAEMIQELLSELVDRAIFLVTGEKEHFKSEEEEEESENVNVSGEFVEKCKALIATLVKLQTKSFATYTGDLAYKRIHRYYSGIRQVEQSIRTHKSLLVLIASDLPKSSQSLLSDQCQQSNVPYAILWTRKKLARLFQCKGKVSAVSIINVNGIDQQFVQTIEQIEPTKENIQPLVTGRNVAALVERQKQSGDLLEKTREQFEERLLLSGQHEDEEDPLAIWVEYISWIDDNYPSGCPDLAKILLRCGKQFQDDDRYKNSLKYLKIWIRYAQNLEDPEELFTWLSGKGIGSGRALLYEAWALVLENKKKWSEAQSVYMKGFDAKAKPLDRLKTRFQAFQSRVESKNLQNEQQDEVHHLNRISDETAQRMNRNRSIKAPAGALFQAQPVSTENNASFQIFVDPAVSNPGNELKPKYEISSENLVNKENTKKPTRWNERQESLAKPLINSAAPSSFQVFQGSSANQLESQSFKSNDDASNPDSTLSFEELRAIHFGFIQLSDISEDCPDSPMDMDITINHGVILKKTNNEVPVPQANISNSLRPKLQERTAQEKPKPLSIFHQPKHNTNQENQQIISNKKPTSAFPLKKALQPSTTFKEPNLNPAAAFEIYDENVDISSKSIEPKAPKSILRNFPPRSSSKTPRKRLVPIEDHDNTTSNFTSTVTLGFGSPTQATATVTINTKEAMKDVLAMWK